MSIAMQYALGIRQMLWLAGREHYERFQGLWPKRILLPPAVFKDFLFAMTSEERAVIRFDARPPGEPNQIRWRSLLIIEDAKTSAAKLINHNNEVEYL
jgi:hypothetical protein